METTRLSTKGQIVLPLSIRNAHGWESGTEFAVEETTQGILLRPLSSIPETTLDQVVGCLKAKRGPATPAEERAAIDKEVRRRHALGRY